MTQAARAMENAAILELKSVLLAFKASMELLVPRKPAHRRGPLRTRQGRGKARTRARKADRRFRREVRGLGSARGYMLFSKAYREYFGESPPDHCTKNFRREFDSKYVVHYEPGRLTISARSTNQDENRRG